MDQISDALRQRIETVCAGANGAKPEHHPIAFGDERMDGALNGAMAQGALHECLAVQTADAAALTGFALALAQRMAGKGRSVMWIHQMAAAMETGRLYPPGIASFGLNPDRIIIVHARRPEDALRAGLDAIRCTELAAAFITIWGTPRALDLTATRRLDLAAARSGVTPFLLRAGTTPQPSSARTRWQVASAPSRPLPANAPGLPTFDLSLLRNRAGAAGQRWRVEWDHEQRQFQCVSPLPRPVAPLPVRRPAETSERPLARTG